MKKMLFLLTGILLAVNLYSEDVAVVTQGTIIVKETEKPKEEVKLIETQKEEAKFIPYTKWEYGGTNVEFVYTFVDKAKETSYAGLDEDFILVLKRHIDKDTWIYAKYDTDDSNPDTKIEILANKKIGKYIEVQLDLDLITSDSKGGIALTEDDDSRKSYIRYGVTDNFWLKMAVYSIDFGMGTELDPDWHPAIPGIIAEHKLSNKFSYYVGMGAKSVDRGQYNIENKFIVTDRTTSFGGKAGFEYKPDGNLLIKGAYSGSNDPEVSVESSKITPGKVAANFIVDYKVGKFGVYGEGTFVSMNKAAIMIDNADVAKKIYFPDKSGTGLYLKAGYDIGKVMETVSARPYLLGKTFSEYFYFGDGDSFQRFRYKDGIEDKYGHGGLNIIAAGVDFKTDKGLTITPEVGYKKAGNKVYFEKDNTIYLNTTVKVKF
jgi:hypothetical protein